ncbi:MAG TPA: mechanosensitive ion channel family protein [Candidatus Binatia bacterium]|nr:mechanosensitive ion channel family protein [Candidatus Binatia bacterium]
MSPDAWESFMAGLMEIALNSSQALLRIVLILAAAYVAAKFLRAGIERLELLLIRAAAASDNSLDSASKRIRTLTGVVWTISFGIIWFMAVLLALGQIGVDLGPILAGAGIVGLAVGFGAQHLVRDLVTGFFLILENHLRIGDAAVINGTSGMVEAITFRTIILRDVSGTVYIFPNGTINTLANMSKDWSAYVIDVTISFKEDSDRVIEIMRNVAEELRGEPKYGSLMLNPLEMFGVEAFTDTGIIIRARFKTLPAKQDAVGREYRRRLIKALEAAGIDLPAQRKP